MQATLSKWGNSKGIRIPAEAIEALDLVVGAKAEVTIDSEKSAIILTFHQPKPGYSRSKKMTLEEFAEGWDGGKVGEEWTGEDVGAELVA